MLQVERSYRDADFPEETPGERGPLPAMKGLGNV